MTNPIRVLATIYFVAALAAAAAGAAELRGRNTIATPSALPDGAQRVSQRIPVDPDEVEKALRALFDAYTRDTVRMEQLLSAEFLDKAPFVDAIKVQLPPFVRLRLLGVRSVQTLEQYVQRVAEGGSELVSTVTATAEAQLEFNENGPQRFRGIHEYIFEVRQEIK